MKNPRRRADDSCVVNRAKLAGWAVVDPAGDMSWVPGFLARLRLASEVQYLPAAYAISRWLTCPTPGPPVRTPSAFGLPWKSLECRTADGCRLAGWVVTPRRPRGTVALFHGIRSNREPMLERVAFLAAAGYRCVSFDHRAHGESGGRRTSFGFHEREDVLAVLALVRRLWPGQPRLALGISMGAAAICYAAGALHGLQAVVLESVYRDIASAFASRMGTTCPAAYARLSRTVIWVTEHRLGLRLEQLAPVNHIAALAPVPVLFLTGAIDAHAPPAHAEQLAASYPGPHQVWIVPGAGHKDVFTVGGAAYRRRVLAFFDAASASAGCIGERGQ